MDALRIVDAASTVNLSADNIEGDKPMCNFGDTLFLFKLVESRWMRVRDYGRFTQCLAEVGPSRAARRVAEFICWTRPKTFCYQGCPGRVRGPIRRHDVENEAVRSVNSWHGELTGQSIRTVALEEDEMR